MYYNNKGSILIFVLIVFSIVSTITMMCIGLNYSNRRISDINYQNIVIKESLLSSIELVHSNILNEVSKAFENSKTEEEFKNYFLGNIFVNNIKDISNSQIQNTTIRIPGKIICDSNDIITFQIESTFKNDNYIKKYGASVKIDTKLNFYNINYKNDDEIEILTENYSNDYIDIYNNTNNDNERDIEFENKNKINNSLIINNGYDNKNIEKNETENNEGYDENSNIDGNDEGVIKINNIEPGKLVTVYNYKEI